MSCPTPADVIYDLLLELSVSRTAIDRESFERAATRLRHEPPTAPAQPCPASEEAILEILQQIDAVLTAPAGQIKIRLVRP